MTDVSENGRNVFLVGIFFFLIEILSGVWMTGS